METIRLSIKSVRCIIPLLDKQIIIVKIKQSRTEQRKVKIKKSKAEQSKAKAAKAKQNKSKQIKGKQIANPTKLSLCHPNETIISDQIILFNFRSRGL